MDLVLGEQAGQWNQIKGIMDDAALWSSALSGSAIVSLYEGTDLLSNSGIYDGADNSVGFWGFNEGMGSTAHDSSGHENHGTLNGPVWITAQED